MPGKTNKINIEYNFGSPFLVRSLKIIFISVFYFKKFEL